MKRTAALALTVALFLVSFVLWSNAVGQPPATDVLWKTGTVVNPDGTLEAVIFTGAAALGGEIKRVGIGTSNAQSTLTVAGRIESTDGGIRFPDGTIQTSAAKGEKGDTGPRGLTGATGARGPVGPVGMEVQTFAICVDGTAAGVGECDCPPGGVLIARVVGSCTITAANTSPCSARVSEPMFDGDLGNDGACCLCRAESP